MRILLVGLKRNYQFQRLKEEAEKRGHTLDGCRTKDLVIYTDTTHFTAHCANIDIESYDLIYSFVSKRRWEWYVLFLYLHDKFGTIIVNKRIISPHSLYNIYPTPLVEYLVQYKSDIPFPRTFTMIPNDNVQPILEAISFPMIVKHGLVHKGQKVYKVGTKEELISKIKTIGMPYEPVVIREFVPNDGDIRVFVIDGKAIGAMKRIPKEGEFRSNISLGGTGKVFDLSVHQDIKVLAEKAAGVLQIEIAGVDIIINKDTGKPYILEVNICPQMEGFEKYTKMNVAEQIITYFEKLYESVSKPVPQNLIYASKRSYKRVLKRVL